MSAITIGDDLVHYEKLGRGRPVILVHGWIGSWRYWIPLMQQLHLKYSVYTLDLIGFGDSSKNPARYTIAEQTQILARFMEQLGIAKAALIGHGLGAMVVTEFSLRYPDRAARVLLLGMPLMDPGDLDQRTPAGQRVLLTTRDRYSLSPPIPEEPTPSDETIIRPNPAPVIDDKTVMRRPNLNEMPTVIRPDVVDRDRLREVATQRRENGTTNALQEMFQGKTLLSLLDKCFKRSEPEYEKIKVDVDKADDRSLMPSAEGYEAGRMLDNLRRITAPLCIVHGADDALMAPPSEEIWQYLSVGKDDMFIPISLPGVRHFPMLEHEAFPRLTIDFLEAADLSKLEIRERWRRRSR